MKFYDRKQELAVLRRIREESRKTARFTVLTGRRRVGKTELIKQAYGADGFLYFFVARRKEAELCDLFASEVAEKLGVDIPGRFERVSQIIRWVMNLAKTREITLVIDEFQELQRVDAGTFSELQRDWDLLHNEMRLNLVVSGSINRLMNKIFKSRKEPLYGRQTEFIKLKPFTTDVLKKILSDFNPKCTGDDLLALYAITGGVAKYVELLMDGGAHTRDAMLSAFFREESTFVDEAKICLSDEFGKDYGTYFTMLSSIAAGRNSRSEIEAAVGGGEVGGYIRNLEREYELIAKSQPIFDKPQSKNSVYQLNDNFYMFWFRFVARHMYMIEIGANARLLELVKRDWDVFSGLALERYFRQKFAESGKWTRIGRWWDRKGENEIDIVAEDELDKRALFVEVKRKVSRASLSDLDRKIEEFRHATGRFGRYTVDRTIKSLEDM